MSAVESVFILISLSTFGECLQMLWVYYDDFSDERDYICKSDSSQETFQFPSVLLPRLYRVHILVLDLSIS